MFYFDPTYLIILPALIIAAIAQAKMSSAYNKYKRIANSRGLSGAMVARRILDENGLSDVPVHRVGRNLSDHYHPTKRSVNLSNDVYDNASIASICIAAHECGHAIQHKVGYAPLLMRSAIAPVAQFASSASVILIIIGIIFGLFNLSMIGIIFFSITVLFQIITLPVEFNASKRALEIIEQDNIIVDKKELSGAKKVLSAAAMTYVAATMVAILQLLRFIMLARSRD